MPTEPTTTLPMVLAGAALAAAGLLRLSGRALRAMPTLVAVAVVVGGGAVAAAGVALFSIEAPTPQLGLRPDASAPAPSAAPAGPARIAAVVSTPSGAPVAGVAVVLHRYERTEEADGLSATTGEDGRVAFDALPTGATTAYRLTADHEGATFSTDLIFLGGDGVDVDLRVATPTSEAGSVSVSLDSMALVGDRAGAQVLHIVRVRNSGQDAYAGGLRLSMLEGAEAFNPSRGLDRTRIAQHGGDLVSLQPLLPGETEFMYTYGVTMPRDGLKLERELRYPTDRLTLLVSGDLDVTGDGLRRGDDVELGEPPRTYRAYDRTGLGEGARVHARVAPQEPSSVGRNLLVTLGVAAAVTIFAGGLLRSRRREVPVAEPVA